MEEREGAAHPSVRDKEERKSIKGYNGKGTNIWRTCSHWIFGAAPLSVNRGLAEIWPPALPPARCCLQQLFLQSRADGNSALPARCRLRALCAGCTVTLFLVPHLFLSHLALPALRCSTTGACGSPQPHPLFHALGYWVPSVSLEGQPPSLCWHNTKEWLPPSGRARIIDPSASSPQEIVLQSQSFLGCGAHSLKAGTPKRSSLQRAFKTFWVHTKFLLKGIGKTQTISFIASLTEDVAENCLFFKWQKGMVSTRKSKERFCGCHCLFHIRWFFKSKIMDARARKKVSHARTISRIKSPFHPRSECYYQFLVSPYTHTHVHARTSAFSHIRK